ncbi:putative pentatricopeptide repeat-containing protein At1g53330 [Punica granatum]|uniref:Pentatricopeptide repeat-containing protein At1g53330 n=1 Tax=Punica granatum TaxID=22663 RepID=A0A6P8EEW6_PUNGR|nr:putative pentatricopeptide repeat-containing protein At1g53330 [Punica granatum]
MTLPKPASPSGLSALLRREKDPKLALRLFQTPNGQCSPEKPFRHSLLSYDLIITKLARAKMFPEMEAILRRLRDETHFYPKEPMFCHVITSYGRSRMPDPAVRTFESIPSFRCRRTVKAFNTLLNALLKCEEYGRMIEFFHNIEKYAYPDACTYNILINACGVVGRLDDACKLFDEMPRRGVFPNVVTFGTLIYWLCVDNRFEEAFELKDNMVRAHGILPNAHIYACLIKAACKVTDLSNAFGLKDEMLSNRVELDSAIYNTLINVLFKAGRKDEVSGLLEEMREKGCGPDTVTYNTMISALCDKKDFEAAHRILDEMAVNGSKPDVISFNVIIRGLCKEGKLQEASDLFEDMPRQGCRPDVVSYRVLFDGLSMHRLLEEAVLILDEMLFQGYAPRDSSLNEFLHNLCEEGKHKLLVRVLTSLGKGNLIEADIWARVVSLVCDKETDLCSETIDHLTDSCV